MDLHTFILDDMDGLVADWVGFARTLPGCAHRQEDELRDHAEAMLRAIAADITSSQSPGEQLAKSHGLAPRHSEADTHAEEHGSHRFSQGFDINELVAEFRALRASVIRRWSAAQSPASMDGLDEFVRFNEAIDQAIAESLWRFAEQARARDHEHERLREQAFRRSERTFFALIEHAPFGVYVVDAQLRLREVNHGAREGAFVNVRPLQGRDLAEALHTIWPDAVAREVHAAFVHTLRTGEPYRAPRFVNRRADVDAVESYEWELHRLRLPDGQDGVVCYYFDSTQLRAAEEALREADRRKDRFLATLAHELRNPLAPIRQAAALARSPGVSPERRQWSVEVIDRQAARMALLLDDLLDVSRITRGRMRLHRRRVELAEVVRSAVETVLPQVQAKRQALHVVVPDTPLVVHGDPLRLSQVVANLLANASRYSGDGAPIEVQAWGDGEQACVRVRDQGIGIPADQLEAVFQMFSQGTAPAVFKEGGLGVGLALARGLAELHGGTLQAHSDGPDRGAEFVMRLPWHPGDQAPVSSPAESPALGRESVLVIDDNADAADSLSELLRQRGHEVQTAYGGMQGLDRAAAFRPQLVLLDIGMPGMDGYEVAQRLRALPGGDAFTIVAVTGWGQQADRQRTAAAGIDFHFTKPVDEAELQPALAEARRRTAA
ncbi:MAG: response regulator [Burkholderiales bacterium]|nr:response regulator [Burkholderiales bacterium]